MSGEANAFTAVPGRARRCHGLGSAAADRAYVIDQGHIVLTGTAAELAHDHRVVDTYLGR